MDAPVELIWNTFNSGLERFIRSKVEDRQTAEDLLQDVYLKIHRNIGTLRDQDRVQAWVYQIARNAIHDYYRSTRAPVDELPEDLIELPEENDEITDRLAHSVRAMIDEMPDDYREALLLTELGGLTQQELADRLGISLSGAKSRVQRGRKLLREMLLSCCHFEFDRLGKVIDYYPHCQCCSNSACAS